MSVHVCAVCGAVMGMMDTHHCPGSIEGRLGARIEALEAANGALTTALELARMRADIGEAANGELVAQAARHADALAVAYGCGRDEGTLVVGGVEDLRVLHAEIDRLRAANGELAGEVAHLRGVVDRTRGETAIKISAEAFAQIDAVKAELSAQFSEQVQGLTAQRDALAAEVQVLRAAAPGGRPPEDMFTSGSLRNAARAGWHAARGDGPQVVELCISAARDDYARESDAYRAAGTLEDNLRAAIAPAPPVGGGR